MDKTADNGNFSVGTLNASPHLLTYNTQPDEEKGTGNISTVLKSNTAQKYIQSKSFSIIKGDLIYASKNAKELEWAQEVGLAINPYNIDENGVLLSSETNLMLMDEVTGTLVIPDMVTAIGEGAFANIRGLKRIIIPPTVKEIGSDAFRGNTEIQEVIIQTNEKGEGLQRISGHAFYGCRAIRTFSIPDTVTDIGAYAFFGCTGLQNIKLSKNANLSNAMLGNCTNLENLEIPEGVKSITGWGTVYNCTSLKTVYIPSTMISISNSCFEICTNIQNITLGENSSNFILENGILLNKDRTQMLCVTKNSIDESGTFSIPDGVSEVPGRSLLFNNLKKIIIPASVTQIHGNSFSPNISEIEIDENNPNYTIYNGNVCSKNKKTLCICVNKNEVVNVDNGIETTISGAFYLCPNVKTIIFPDSFTTLDENAFSDSRVVNIKFGKGLNSISTLAFNNNVSIKSIEISSENANYVAEGGAVYNKDKTKLIRLAKHDLEKFVIPNSVTSIEEYAFQSKPVLKVVEIPNSVTTIGKNDFEACGISKIYIPESVESIGDNAFMSANNLTEIQINKNKGSISGSPWRVPIGERAIKWLQE